jgi:chromosomal replication initiation ATPase DnaA
MTQLPLAFTAAPSYEAVDFHLSDANRAAYDAVMQTPRWSGYGMRLCGPAGSGRTHLAHLWAAQEGARFIAAPENAQGPHLVLDDAFRIRDEAALFHLLNRVRGEKGRILLVFDETPLAQRFTLPDLLSRLNALPQARITQPDDALLAAVLAKQLSDRQLRVAAEVVDYLLPRLPRSFADVRDFARMLDAEALSRHRSITPALARELLARLGKET